MIRVNFTAYGTYTTDSLYQWDKDQLLTVTGLNLNHVPEFHFSNGLMDRAIVKQGSIENGVISVVIPNSILQYPLTVKAHIGYFVNQTYTTVEVVEIPIIPKTRPADYTLEVSDDEYYSFSRLENELANKLSYSALKTETDRIEGNIDDVRTSVTTLENELAQITSSGNRVASETVLFTGNLNETNKTGTLSDNPSNYDYLDFYYQCDETHKSEIYSIPADQTSLIISHVDTSTVSSVNNSIYVREVNLTISGTTVTVGRYIKVSSVTGNSTISNVTTAGAAGSVVKVVGRRAIGNTEVEDIRNGADGVTYASAGLAVRTQLNKKLNKNQGSANAGKALIVGDDGNVNPGELASIAQLNAKDTELDTRVTALESRPVVDRSLTRRVENLEAAAQGVLYRAETDNTTASEKLVPPDAMPWAILDSVDSEVSSVISIGKNQYAYKQGQLENINIPAGSRKGYSFYVSEDSVIWASIPYPIEITTSVVLNVYILENGVDAAGTSMGRIYNSANGVQTLPNTVQLQAGNKYAVVCTNALIADELLTNVGVMIERGTIKTVYSPYRKTVYDMNTETPPIDIEVQAGGVLSFVDAQDAPVSVQSQVTYLIKTTGGAVE